jgi:hypothetical protein
MRRASASDRLIGAGLAAGALAVVLTVGSPAVSAVADDSDDAGKLSLNTTVLVNESVGAGSSGEFPIRSSLFSDRLSARAELQRSRSAERLGIVERLDFAESRSSGEQYQSVRAVLFEGYSSDVIASTSDEREESAVPFSVIFLVAVPLVLVGGIVLGRLWARRSRVTS